MSRRVTKLNKYVSIPDQKQPILIADSGCDQSVVTNHWRILCRKDRFVSMSGAFSGRTGVVELPVVSAACKLTTEYGIQYAAIIHEALWDETPTQVESLLSIHQVLQLKRNAIDDRSKCENDIEGRPGTQSARFDKTRWLSFSMELNVFSWLMIYLMRNCETYHMLN